MRRYLRVPATETVAIVASARLQCVCAGVSLVQREYRAHGCRLLHSSGDRYSSLSLSLLSRFLNAFSMLIT